MYDSEQENDPLSAHKIAIGIWILRELSVQ